MRKSRWIPVIILAALVAWHLWPEPSLSHPPGVLVSADPDQRPLQEPLQWQKNGYQIHALAKFRIKALVLRRERYRFDRGSKLSPVDLALGWGSMSDQSIIDQLDISQGYRWYHWSAKKLPVPAGVIMTHSANMHMIPATDDVEEILLSVIRGNIVDLQGYLVDVRGQEGWKWVSSLRRDDTGDGSCELIYIESASVQE